MEERAGVSLAHLAKINIHTDYRDSDIVERNDDMFMRTLTIFITCCHRII